MTRNLISLTKQECFDNSTQGIIAQGGPSLSPLSFCRYRAEDGRKCAAGQLIPDELYDPEMESRLASCIDQIVFSHPGLVDALQRAHDVAAKGEDFFSAWHDKLLSVAVKYDLETTVLEEIPI